MPRAKLIRSDSQPYHITSRSNNKDWFYIPTQFVWQYANELLMEGKTRFNIQVDAFVLMNNHYHLCIHTPDANIDKFMHFFNKNLGKRISRHANRINRIFGAPYKWNLISNDSYYFNVIKYIYQNPLRARMVKSCLDYPYSDLKTQMFTSQELEWFDEPIPSEEVKLTATKLRRFNIKN
ncbi:MAG: putative transposase [Bacteriovoracaceae bacterium]|jgi:putative transposase